MHDGLLLLHVLAQGQLRARPQAHLLAQACLRAQAQLRHACTGSSTSPHA
jgi:hypothetical protein